MKRIMTILLLLSLKFVCLSQSYDDNWKREIGISINAMNCNTDIGGLPVDMKSFKLGAGIYAGMLYQEKIGLRLEATLGSVTASDKRAMNYDLKDRNLDFTSTIKEISLLAEVHPFNLISAQNTTHALSPYLLAGVGYFGFNPRTQLNGQWIYLQPLHTEGEGFAETGRPNYKLASFNFPIGGGLQYNLSERLILRGEVVYRFLNTDYLDDVSTTYIDPNLFDKYLLPEDAVLAKRLADRSYDIAENGTREPGSIRGSSKKDAYYSINIKLGIRLFQSSGSLYSNFKNKKRDGCAAFKAL